MSDAEENGHLRRLLDEAADLIEGRIATPLDPQVVGLVARMRKASRYAAVIETDDSAWPALGQSMV